MGDLGRNLALLCSFQPSIAEVCRRLGMNRQQFNKYLNGSAVPSRRNLRLICDFFGVTESEIILEAPEFSEIISIRNLNKEESVLGPANAAVNSLLRASEAMDRYEGFYYRYFPSYGYPGKFVKSLGCISRVGRNFFWKNNETLRRDDVDANSGFGKWHGIFLSFADRLYLVEYDTATMASPISSSIFYASYRSRVDYLIGVQTGTPLRRGRQPAVSRVVLEFLGKEIDIRACLKRCGLLTRGNPELEEKICGMLDGSKTRGVYFLEAEDL